jgi:hypothetical protein
MLKNNIYNTDKEFDYATINDMVVKSLEKIGKKKHSKIDSISPMVPYPTMQIMAISRISTLLPRLHLY